MDINQDQDMKKPKVEIVDDGEEKDTSASEDSSIAAQESEVEKEEEDVLATELKKAKREAQEYKDKFMRVVAEMDNLRKRSEKERANLLKYGHEKVLEDLLPVLDSFDKAVQVADGTDVAAVVDGMKLVSNQLVSTLEKHGLSGFDSVGEGFDPNFHQAIQKIDDPDVKEEVVKEEFQKGYKLKDRLLRAAIVSVAVPKD
ncbi:MAG: nucleotide exchange factor GrpE [Pseudobacteriovorax sp.]|nr:nucleotide exchange factor GrpE [Pseudobacteriovorax sp.]